MMPSAMSPLCPSSFLVNLILLSNNFSTLNL